MLNSTGVVGPLYTATSQLASLDLAHFTMVRLLLYHTFPHNPISQETTPCPCLAVLPVILSRPHNGNPLLLCDSASLVVSAPSPLRASRDAPPPLRDPLLPSIRQGLGRSSDARPSTSRPCLPSPPAESPSSMTPSWLLLNRKRRLPSQPIKSSVLPAGDVLPSYERSTCPRTLQLKDLPIAARRRRRRTCLSQDKEIELTPIGDPFTLICQGMYTTIS
ncbi:hypothetical protein HU200_038398 [Digitaria exilis]|uniref:Uncharacterized protein n=1 Tax=Digitaria exilis TaxID=1010633 RepID=A0A835ELX4_9POAL|nr:hypothetical protein HU200_038398 [Digitaria exilis]